MPAPVHAPKETTGPQIQRVPEAAELPLWKIACLLEGGGDSRRAITDLNLEIRGRTPDKVYYLVVCPLGWKEEAGLPITRFIDDQGRERIRQYNLATPPRIRIVKLPH